MVTKEQALNCKHFKQIAAYRLRKLSNFPFNWVDSDLPADSINRPINWRANGKCKTWKTRPDEFKLPIKHGLYDYGYITHENAHLFEVA